MPSKRVSNARAFNYLYYNTRFVYLSSIFRLFFTTNIDWTPITFCVCLFQLFWNLHCNYQVTNKSEEKYSKIANFTYLKILNRKITIRNTETKTRFKPAGLYQAVQWVDDENIWSYMRYMLQDGLRAKSLNLSVVWFIINYI